jgi:hypothetical protein
MEHSVLFDCFERKTVSLPMVRQETLRFEPNSICLDNEKKANSEYPPMHRQARCSSVSATAVACECASTEVGFD